MPKYHTPEDDNLVERIRGINQNIRKQSNSLRLTSAAVGKGGMRVRGGELRVQDNAGNDMINLSSQELSLKTGLHLDSTAYFEAKYPSGNNAVFFGDLIQSGAVTSSGLTIQRDLDDTAGNIFIAYEDYSSNTRHVSFGQSGELPITSFGGWTENMHILCFNNNGGFSVFGADAFVIAEDGDAYLFSRDTGAVRLISTAGEAFTAYVSTGNAANCHLAVDGQIMRSTSSRRYKTDIRDFEIDPADVLKLRPRTWLPNVSARVSYAGHPDPESLKFGNEPTKPVPSKPVPPTTPSNSSERCVGFVSEELDEIGLGIFVEHNEQGEPEGIAYDRLSTALVKVIQHQQTQLQIQEAKINDLTDRITRIENLVGNGVANKPTREDQ